MIDKLGLGKKSTKIMKIRKCLSYYPLPTGAHMSTIKDGDSVIRGDILARLPFEASKSSDIVSGLPRVTELFEARKPRDAAFIATIDGKIHLQGISRGMRVLKVINSETGLESETYRIPVGKHLHFQEGEEVKSGEQLTDGPINHTIFWQFKGKRLFRIIWLVRFRGSIVNKESGLTTSILK